MTWTLSPNCQAILLLTSPLITGRRTQSAPILTLGEYARLARALRGMSREPADLLGSDAATLLPDLAAEVDRARLESLLGRGFQLSQALERWRARAIWVVSRADAGYPRRWKARLGEQSPPAVYGCGDIGRLDQGGLAVVGSRQTDAEVLQFAREVGQAAAGAGRQIVSGGARGVDLAAMRGCVDAGGTAVGVLAEGLGKVVLVRENRDLLLDGRLVLVSPYDPAAGFTVPHAMQRNKLIYTLADAALVVQAEAKRGGTWAGAVEQLDRLKLVPVYVRSSGEVGPGLIALREKGARPWPESAEGDPFAAVFAPGMRREDDSPASPAAYDVPDATEAPDAPDAPDPQTMAASASGNDGAATVRENEAEYGPKATGGELGFEDFRAALGPLLVQPRTEREIAATLGVPVGRTRAWLRRLVEAGIVEKRGRPMRYGLRIQGELRGMGR